MADETSITSETTQIDSTGTRSILSKTDNHLLHARNVFKQKRKNDLKVYKHLHSIDMQIHTIPKLPNQKIHNMGLSDLHEEGFKLFTMEYNSDLDTPPSSELEYYINKLQHHNEDYDPGINDMFLNNLDPTLYTMQMQNPVLLTRAHMKIQGDTDNLVESQAP
jgi:hypothetical protein